MNAQAPPFAPPVPGPSPGATPTVTTAGALPLLDCHQCGLLQTAPELPDGATARCPRCDGELYARDDDGIAKGVMLNLAALIFFSLANYLAFLSIAIGERQTGSHLASGALSFLEQGYWELALVVFVLLIAAPFLKILAALYVLTPAFLGWPAPPHAAQVYRLQRVAHPWAMAEVFLLGTLVAYVKLVGMVQVTIHPGFWALVAMILTMVWAEAAVEPRAVWEWIAPSKAHPPLASGEERHLVACHACGLVSPVPPRPADARAEGGAEGFCPRCGGALHHRKPDSLARAWALVAASIILYIPANLFPVMTVISLGRGEPSTILAGVEELIGAGMWPLALVVFFASITVPMLKLAGLIYLLVSVRRRSRWRPRDRTRLYRVVEAVGRWSMIDVFVVAILVALIQLGALATIDPGPGLIAFCGVVILTMIGAMAFDPRLIWDAAGYNHD